MSTIREDLEAIALNTLEPATHDRVIAALDKIEAAKRAWRDSGETYRLIPDTYETQEASR